MTLQNDEALPEKFSQALAKTLPVDDYAARAVHAYTDFFTSLGISGTLWGQIVLTIITCVFAIILMRMIDRTAHFLDGYIHYIQNRFHLRHQRFNGYLKTLRLFFQVAVFVLFIYTLTIVWRAGDWTLLQSAFLAQVAGTGFNILFIAAIGVIIWEAINSFIEYTLYKSPDHRRLGTLLPMLRHLLGIMFGGLFTLIILSEIGINIMPLLAGAGVVGIAIGFGAQTMVKDFITGFTIILEDLIQVGDVVRLAGKSGVVEQITIRKVQLRDADGAVYTIPFSEITIVENLTKDFSYYVLNISIDYHEDTDRVIEALRAVDADLRNDPAFKVLALDPIQIMGIDQFADSAVVIKARIKTLPGKQWEVGREFNRRMKKEFEARGVELPLPLRTVRMMPEPKG